MMTDFINVYLMSLFSQLIVFFLTTDDTYKFDINFTWEIKN